MKRPLLSCLVNAATRRLGKSCLASLAVVLSIGTVASPASADQASDAKAFIERQSIQMAEALKKNAPIEPIIDQYVNYDMMTKSSFGDPCPILKPKCTNHYQSLTAEEKARLSELMRKYVRGTYRKNAKKTLDYTVVVQNDVKVLAPGISRVRTNATPKNERDEPVQLEYIVRDTNGKLEVIDTIAEMSSFTKNLNDQFSKFMETDGQKFPHVVKRLEEKTAKLATGG